MPSSASRRTCAASEARAKSTSARTARPRPCPRQTRRDHERWEVIPPRFDELRNVSFNGPGLKQLYGERDGRLRRVADDEERPDEAVPGRLTSLARSERTAQIQHRMRSG